MAPSKTPGFAVCGGLSVETVVVGVGRRRLSSKTTRRSAVGGLADSLYSDLLWDCGGANVENPTAPVGTAVSTKAYPNEDFSDVFGGPPKFASISSQLMFRRGVTKVPHACSDEVFFIEASPALDCIGQTPLIVQKTFENPTSSPCSAKSVKVRSITETDFSSRICHSDSENKCSPQHKGERDVSSVASSRASSRVRTATTFMRQKESFRSDVEEDTQSFNISKSPRKAFISMKENIEGCAVSASEQEGKFANVYESVTCFVKDSQVRKQSLDPYDQHCKAHRQNHTVKIEKGTSEEIWVTIKDIQCATEPSRFPPPLRRPPGIISDTECVSRNTFPKQSTFDSVSVSLSCSTGDLNTKASVVSKAMEDAVEIAEAKIKMVVEAREKAKLMVEKKLREKRRAQQLRERSARDGKPGAKGELKEHIEDWKGKGGNSKARYSQSNINKLEAERTRQRDTAKQCFEKARELQNKSASNVQEKVAESKFSHNVSKETVEVRKEHTAKIDVNQTTVRVEPTSQSGLCCFETSGGYQKHSSCEDSNENVVEEASIVPSQQQQVSLSKPRCSTEQQALHDFSSLDDLDPMSSTHNTPVLLHGMNSSSVSFQEITGETLERRMARWDRSCRTSARMAKALEEKKKRDLERQKEQADRHRVAEMLDQEIKVWASGKEGNLEALLCSLHLVLWPECGWKGASPADLSTTAAVKKAYRRATLCVHPDKVQQRGATVAQKYIAEKVYDLLREASAIYK